MKSILKLNHQVNYIFAIERKNHVAPKKRAGQLSILGGCDFLFSVNIYSQHIHSIDLAFIKINIPFENVPF